MKLPYRTLAGALLGLLLIVLFYTRMAQESGDIIKSQQAASRDASRDASSKAKRIKLKAQADSASEATWRKNLIAALATRQRTTPLTREELAAAALAKAAKQEHLADSIANAAKSKQDANFIAARTTKPPAPITSARDAKSPPKKPLPAPSPGWTDWLRQQLPWLLPLLAVLGVFTLTMTGWLVWRERQKPLVEPQREDLDPPVLRALLLTYASEIGQCLPIPRQVKRFASKARLQNYLVLEALKKNPEALDPTTQEVLAFLVLLLVEGETGREDKAEAQLPSGAPAPKRLRDSAEEDFIEQVRPLFDTWHQQESHEAAYRKFEKLAAGTKVPPYEVLPAALKSPNGGQLLGQLHRLNTGLLV